MFLFNACRITARRSPVERWRKMHWLTTSRPAWNVCSCDAVQSRGHPLGHGVPRLEKRGCWPGHNRPYASGFDHARHKAQQVNDAIGKAIKRINRD